MIKNSPYIIESYTSKQLTSNIDEISKEIAEEFRSIYANGDGKHSNGFGQFIFYPSEGRAIAPCEIMENIKYNDFVELSSLDNFPLENYYRKDLNEYPLFWHDPEETLKAFREKFSHDAYISIIRNTVTKKITGCTFGKDCSLDEAFRNEEWENPYRYSKLRNHQHYRDISLFIDTIKNTLLENRENFKNIFNHLGRDEISAFTQVHVWNNLFVSEEIRSRKQGNLLREMLHRYFSLIPEEKTQYLFHIGESQKYNFDGSLSKAYTIFKNAGAIDAIGFLSDHDPKPGESTLIVSSLKQMKNFFTQSEN